MIEATYPEQIEIIGNLDMTNIPSPETLK